MWFRVYVVLFLVTFVASAPVIKSESSRPKRTIQYFFDGLLSVLNKHANLQTSRDSNDHRLSPLVAISKLSAISAQPKMFDSSDEVDESIAENVIRAVRKKASSHINQLPIPLISTTTNSPITQSSETNLETHQSNSSMREKDLSVSTMASNETTSIVSVLRTIDPDFNLTANTSVIPTTLDPPLEIVTENMSSNGGASTVSNIDMKNPPEIPIKASDRHTTQFFGSPLIVERHRDSHILPLYVNNCAGVKCPENDSKEVHPYVSPNLRGFPIISMAIALPVPISRADQHSQTDIAVQNYELYTLHSVPTVHSNNTKS